MMTNSPSTFPHWAPRGKALGGADGLSTTWPAFTASSRSHLKHKERQRSLGVQTETKAVEETLWNLLGGG